MDIKKLPLITETKGFNGGSWYREGMYLIVNRKKGSHAMPPGLEVDVNCSITHTVSSGDLESAFFIVDGWKPDAKIVSKPNSVLLQAHCGQITRCEYGSGSISQTKASLAIAEAISGIISVDVVFAFKNPVTGVGQISLKLNGTKTFGSAQVLDKDLTCSASFLTNVQAFAAGDLLSVELDESAIKNPEETRIDSLNVSIMNAYTPTFGTNYFKKPEDKHTITANITVGETKLTLEYPSDKPVDLSAIVKAIGENK